MWRVSLGLIRCVVLAAVIPMAYAQQALDAISTFEQVRQSLVGDQDRRDWNGYLDDAQKLKLFLNGSPSSVLEVARAQMQLGDNEQALAEAQSFVGMGQVNELLDSTLFRPIRSSLDAQIQHNRSLVSIARLSWQLSDPGLLVEDIDYDSRTKRFFATSILKQKVITLDTHGRIRDFVISPDRWPMMAVKVDSRRRRLWVTEVALEGYYWAPKSDWGHSALLKFDLDHRKLIGRYEGPPSSSLGDMTLAANGDPIVSDGDGGGIYRLRGRQLRRIDHGEFVSPQTVALCRDGRHAFVPDYLRGIASLDLAKGEAHWVSTGGRFALNGIDGLYCRGSTLLAVQNGAMPERVISFELDATRTAVTGERVIERGTPTLGEPTHGVIVGDIFYYIANSGWDVMDEHGATRRSMHLTRPMIMRTPIPASSDIN